MTEEQKKLMQEYARRVTAADRARINFHKKLDQASWDLYTQCKQKEQEALKACKQAGLHPKDN